MKSLKLVTIISLIFSISSIAEERLVGDWKPNVDKIKASKEYKAQGSPKWVDIFADKYKVPGGYFKEISLPDLFQRSYFFFLAPPIVSLGPCSI